MTAGLTFLHALSPLHAGVGQGAGIIDLPIAREKATGLPYLPGSSLKGTLRSQFEPGSKDCQKLFGREPIDAQTNDNHASSVQFSDQRLLLFPTRSLAGTFAWVTSPYILNRLVRDIRDAQCIPPEHPIPRIQAEENYVIAGAASKIQVEAQVYLEDLKFTTVQTEDSEAAEAWAEWIAVHVFPGENDLVWREMLKARFCIIHDDVLSFLLETATEITARIKLKADAKAVEDGGLWYEEALPTETILSGLMLATPTKAAGIDAEQAFQLLAQVTNKTLQFGGKATVGHGLCKFYLAREPENGK
jgi:CRISPR-associated protein Cmr4